MIPSIKKTVNLGQEIYDIYIIKRGKKLPFIAFVTFLLTFLISRFIVIWIEAGRPFLNFFQVSDYHIHHFYLGIFLITFSNFLFLLQNKKYMEEIKVSSSILFGIGLSLITDEFGLLLTMEFNIKGDYWAPHSYYLLGILSEIFLYSIIFPNSRSKSAS